LTSARAIAATEGSPDQFVPFGRSLSKPSALNAFSTFIHQKPTTALLDKIKCLKPKPSPRMPIARLR
jgi:hypothetical protein